MTHAVSRPHSQGLLIWQVPSLGLNLARYGFGGLIFAGGSFFMVLMVQGPWSFYRAGGWGALPEALPGLFVSTLFCAILLPLGAWMLFMRSRWRVDLSARTLVEEVDWRFGRKVKAYAIGDYQTLWLGMAEVAPSSTDTSVSVLTLRVKPIDARRTPSLKLAWFDDGDDEAAQALAAIVSQATGLPLELEDKQAQRPKRRRAR
jgi:hypothetical protein